MKVIICGAGQVGWQIARHLSGENNDVTVVDNNPDLVRRATDTLDVQGIAGFASYPDILDRAGARDADMIIAATYSDEVNMVTCQVAHSIFAIPRKIARLRSQSYLDAIYSDLYRRDHMPIDVMISPEREVAAAALQRLSAPAAFDTETFLDGRAQFLGITIDDDCPVVNTPLRQLTDLFSTLRTIVVGIRREGRLFAPEPNDMLFPGDACYICVVNEDVPRTMEVFGKTTRTQERVIIVGGGNVGLAVAKKLEAKGRGIRSKVIEKSRKIAEVAADALERTIVLHGDGLDKALLSEAGVNRADAILCVTDDDKTNMLAAVRAKAAGCEMAIALINDPSLVPLMTPLGIDAHINPRQTTVSSILRHIRHGRVRGVYSVGDAEAEVIEAEVLSTSPMAGRSLRDIEFPEGVLIGAILQGDKVVKPVGDLKIEAGDVVLIFALADDVPEVERLLQVSIDYF
ncbi:Trk system potassium transporter TrkA [Pseudooceanicola nitratireducens]|jgi:trk system potassium uptake protein TrkA|uniref:Trk system potassium uptake protein TrkA n=1 Tax=Pseudooceanicola nitratireducens TaxID=517719 RepID=A0A1I1LHE8_9RHOB|nr:Trk system potassium transporter TrkA [Pseudooceanicola nitratireducens]MEC7297589.1 Trk system potassium transporter TrkA [Pseudomonadota bacterium]MBY6157243.1 Trk system potassium transporter TrkA [Pseudooceanicola nitratireducens]MEC7794204.1 Trk system potassium transporter TrkA [Pseudomonadota bacterium]MEC8667591.1 Trk system potassium transporter TrkA [Pseudomonadota bacterium]SEJ62797.1 trk system potassium uptake protein TrkA [Pseudooceanicola nitratireducens]